MKACRRILVSGLRSTLVISSVLLCIPSYGAGWNEIENTSLEHYCLPSRLYDYSFSYYCKNVIYAWNSGALDQETGTMYIWGGGHTDYYGNELYSVNPLTEVMARITDACNSGRS